MELKSTEALQEMISKLNTLSGDDLPGAMTELKIALKENPTACLLLLPEDIGQMVTALRKIVGESIAISKKETKAKTKKISAANTAKMTQQELMDAFDEM